MKRRQPLPIPAIKVLRKMGGDINDARRRRRITISLMAERAGISRATVGSIEKGDPATSIGSYAAVLFVLGMVERLGNVVDAIYDVTGRQLEDEKLPKRVRLLKTRKYHE
jgi:DNA-binding XRE family transcriptional regulator